MGNKTQIEWVNRVYTGEKSRLLCHFLFSLINPKPQLKPYRKVEEGTTCKSSDINQIFFFCVDFFFTQCCNTNMLKYTHTAPSNQNLIISLHSSPDSLGCYFVRGSPGVNTVQSQQNYFCLSREAHDGVRTCQNNASRVSVPEEKDYLYLTLLIFVFFCSVEGAVSELLMHFGRIRGRSYCLLLGDYSLLHQPTSPSTQSDLSQSGLTCISPSDVQTVHLHCAVLDMRIETRLLIKFSSPFDKFIR